MKAVEAMTPFVGVVDADFARDRSKGDMPGLGLTDLIGIVRGCPRPAARSHSNGARIVDGKLLVAAPHVFATAALAQQDAVGGAVGNVNDAVARILRAIPANDP